MLPRAAALFGYIIACIRFEGGIRGPLAPSSFIPFYHSISNGHSNFAVKYNSLHECALFSLETPSRFEREEHDHLNRRLADTDLLPRPGRTVQRSMREASGEHRNSVVSK